MQIEYTKSHYWLKPVGENILDPFSKSNREKLKSTLKRYEEEKITHTIEPVSDELLDWFEPLYTETLLKKDNPDIHDVRSNVTSSDINYYSLTLKQSNKNIGATIFSIKNWYLSIAHRVYPNFWPDGVKLRSNPSLLTEYFLAEYAKEKGIKFISHGKDRNPHGPNSYIGLASYKLAVGCKIFINSREEEFFTLDQSEIKTDTLVLHRPKEKIRITDATLFTSEENLDRYTQVTKFPDLLKVNVITI